MIREGTDQNQRLQKFLLPDSILVDERTTDDLINFGHEYSRLLQYYNKQNQPAGTWQSFFDHLEQNKTNQPHTVLFYTFLELFTYIQKKTNTLTEKHLDYYYRDVLRFAEKPVIPDQVFVLFELLPSVKSHRVAAQTPLLAGQDDNGEDLIYQLDKEIVLNQAKVAEIKSVFIDKAFEQRIYAAPMANSADGQGLSFEKAELAPLWAPFGQAPAPLDAEERKKAAADIGFALASPLLFLKEGTRTVTLELDYQLKSGLSEEDHSDEIISPPEISDLTNAFIVYFSGAEGWIGPFTVNEAKTTNENKLTIKVEIAPIEPAVVAYDAEILSGKLQTPWPVMKVVLNTETDYYAYPWLTQQDLQQAKIKVEVEGVSDLLLQNDDGLLDPNKPFTPFGYEPYLGSSFYIGSEEVFYKKLASCKLLIDWDSIPAASLDEYYSKYLSPSVHSALQGQDVAKTLALIALQGDDPSEVELQLATFKDKVQQEAKDKALQRAKTLGKTDQEAETEAEAVAELESALRVAQLAREIASAIEENSEADQETETDQPSEQPDTSASESSPEAGQEESEVETQQPDNSEPEPSSPAIRKTVEAAIQKTEANTLSTNQHFKVKISLLQNKTWQALQNQSGSTNDGMLNSFYLFNQNNVYMPTELNPRPPEHYDRYGIATQNRFLKIVLSAPVATSTTPIEAFGHQDYPDLLSEIITLNAQAGEEIFPVPNEPYTPVIRSLTLNYSSEQAFLSGDDSDLVEQFFHLDALGENEVSLTTGIPLLPQYPNEGNVYLGLSDLDPGQIVNILFRVAEGTADSRLNLAEGDLRWYYLVDNQWQALPLRNLLSDSTRQLQASGIVSLETPKDISNDNTRLPAGFHWLSAALERNAGMAAQWIAVHTQAATATATTSGSDRILPADTVTGPQEYDPAIKSVSQPYPSFNGRGKEAGEAFYTRISERLRHKNRAVSLWDYERLVLEQFPDIFKVKCVNHTQGTDRSVAGAVTVVVVADIRNQRVVNPLEPRASLKTLEAIKDYLRDHTSTFVDIDVVNPRFERIHIDVEVRFRDGYDAGFYTKRLNQELKEYLSPWAFDSEAWDQLRFTTRIYRSRIIAFIEQRPYVDFIYKLELKQYSQDNTHVTLIENEAASATTHQSILVSASEHTITFLSDPDSLIQGAVYEGIGYISIFLQLKVRQPIGPGIGQLKIGDTFTLTDPPIPGKDQ